jgi:hypothetical protein
MSQYISQVTYIKKETGGKSITVHVPYKSEHCKQHLVKVTVDTITRAVVSDLFAWNEKKRKWEWYSTLPGMDSPLDHHQEGLLKAAERYLNRYPIPGFTPQRQQHAHSKASS